LRQDPSPYPPPPGGEGTTRSDPAARLHRTAIAIALVFGLAGAGFLGQGVWIHAKAWAAQALIRQAWAARQAGDPAPRPWPWADTYPLARLGVPRLGIERMVLAGASGRTLAFGPGRIEGTALPGEAGVSVLSGHRDTHFAFLKDLQPGDTLTLEQPGGRVDRFIVGASAVVHEEEATLPAATQDGGAWLVLATCWPFDAVDPGTPWRYLVIARRI
jgi:sortase A